MACRRPQIVRQALFPGPPGYVGAWQVWDMTTAAEREQACSRFLEHQPIAYIRVEHIESVRTCILVCDDGEPIAVSECGMVPLISYAASHGLELLTRH